MPDFTQDEPKPDFDFFNQQAQQPTQPKQPEQPEQETPKQPYFYINGMPFVQDSEGNFHFAEGRYAPLQGVAPSNYKGVVWGSAPIIEQYGKPAHFKVTDKGVELTDSEDFIYAEPFIGAEASYKGRLKQVLPDLKQG